MNPKAYTSGLQFDESLGMCGRLTELAKSRGLSFGAKFSNTLEVVNHRDFFPPSEKMMYLSGPPLHVITLTLADEFRQAVGPELPISFSAGVDRKNFANIVACGIVPVTTCTDLLKTGGYGRLPPYLHDLAEGDASGRCARRSTTSFSTPAASARRRAATRVQAGWLEHADHRRRNAGRPAVHGRQERDGAAADQFAPGDCSTASPATSACRSARTTRTFSYETPPVDLHYRDVEVAPDGTIAECGDERHFVVERKEQIANFADYCNHCGNCDTFCPE